MTTVEKVKRIIDLQKETLDHVQKAKALILEADAIGLDIGLVVPEKRFFCDGDLYIVRYKAYGFMPGNRYWIEQEKDIEILGA